MLINLIGVFLEEETKRIDEGRAVNVIYVNFSKALKVQHGRLSGRLDNIFSRFRFLNNEGCGGFFCFVFFVWRPVTSGVSVTVGGVGPTAVCCNLNDLDDHVANVVIKFANDTNIGGIVDSEVL